MKMTNCNANKAKNVLSKIPEMIQGTSGLTQLGIGAVSGGLTGYLTMKFGRGVAVVAGSGIILAQIACGQGIGTVDWPTIQKKAIETHEKLNKSKVVTNAKYFTHTNTYFAAGFVGAFLISAALN